MNMVPIERDGWSEYQLLVLAELKRHNDVLEHTAREIAVMKVDLAVFEKVEKRMTDLERQMNRSAVDIGMLQVKAGVWGGVAGLMVAIATAILYSLQH